MIAALRHRCPHCHAGISVQTPGSQLKCDACGAIFLIVDGIPSLIASGSNTELREYFSRVAAQIRTHKRSYTAFAAPHLEMQLAILSAGFIRALERWVPQGSLILDVGCGHGGLLETATQSYRMVGIDFVPEMLTMARERGYAVYNADGSALPFEDAQFDAVVCAELFNQFPDIRPFLAEAIRVCRPGGSILISTLNRDSILRVVVGAAMSLLRPKRDLPVFTGLRRPSDIMAAGDDLPVDLQEVAWLLSPTRLVRYARSTHDPVSPFATNFIMCLSKRGG